MNQTPLVTVAIPTRNRASLLERCLASVLAQSLDDIRVVVSDNASTDDTAEVVKSFEDARIQYARLDRNIGLHGNWSRCLELSESPYRVVLPDDDLMLPGNLEQKVRFLEDDPRLAFVHSAFQIIGGGGEVLNSNADWIKAQVEPIETGMAFIRRSISGSGRVNMSSVVMRGSVLAGDRFERADGLALDFGLLLRLAIRGYVGYIDEPLVAYRFHEASLSVQEGLQGIGQDSLYGGRFDQISLDQRVKARFLSIHVRELQDARALRKASRQWANGELIRLIVKDTFPDRSFARTRRLFLEAARIEPSVLLQPKAVRLILGSTAGAKGRAAVHRLSPRRALRGHRRPSEDGHARGHRSEDVQ